jgi:hypothetical protein
MPAECATRLTWLSRRLVTWQVYPVPLLVGRYMRRGLGCAIVGFHSAVTRPGSQRRTIGLRSDPRLLEISRNTIDAVDQWLALNGESAFFPAAARVGYDSDVLLNRVRGMMFQPNGIVVNPMHMLENSSIVPNTVNEMLLQSHGGTIRLFPVWPRRQDARFLTWRAYGAFLVSADLAGGTVKDVAPDSRAGLQ